MSKNKHIDLLAEIERLRECTRFHPMDVPIPQGVERVLVRQGSNIFSVDAQVARNARSAVNGWAHIPEYDLAWHERKSIDEHQ